MLIPGFLGRTRPYRCEGGAGSGKEAAASSHEEATIELFRGVVHLILLFRAKTPSFLEGGERRGGLA